MKSFWICQRIDFSTAPKPSFPGVFCYKSRLVTVHTRRHWWNDDMVANLIRCMWKSGSYGFTQALPSWTLTCDFESRRGVGQRIKRRRGCLWNEKWRSTLLLSNGHTPAFSPELFVAWRTSGGGKKPPKFQSQWFRHRDENQRQKWHKVQACELLVLVFFISYSLQAILHHFHFLKRLLSGFFPLYLDS